MNNCLCGNPADGDGVLCPRCAALRVLELNPGATEKQIKNAYRLLAKVWHPDRFQGDKALTDAAESKLKEINSAYRFLTSKSPKDAGRQGGESAGGRSGRATRTPQDGCKTSRREATRSTTPIQIPTAWIFPSLKISIKFLLVAFAILFARYIWIAFDVQDSTSDAATKVYGYGKDTVLRGLEEPKRRFLEAVEHDLQRLGLEQSAAPQQAVPQMEEPIVAPKTPARQLATIKAAKAAPLKVYPYLTIGSTRDEAIDQLGTPTAFTENKLVYGKSELYLKDNSVIGWRIDQVSSPIRVKAWPGSRVDPELSSFTVGSSMDVVLAVQGTPTTFSEDKFEYGRSEVLFQNRRVVQWKDDPASIPLHASLP